MPASEPTHRNGENVTEVQSESDYRRQWIDWRLGFITDDLLNPAIVNQRVDDDAELIERVRKAKFELDVIEKVLEIDPVEESEYRV